MKFLLNLFGKKRSEMDNDGKPLKWKKVPSLSLANFEIRNELLNLQYKITETVNKKYEEQLKSERICPRCGSKNVVDKYISDVFVNHCNECGNEYKKTAIRNYDEVERKLFEDFYSLLYYLKLSNYDYQPKSDGSNMELFSQIGAHSISLFYYLDGMSLDAFRVLVKYCCDLYSFVERDEYYNKRAENKLIKIFNLKE